MPKQTKPPAPSALRNAKGTGEARTTPETDSTPYDGTTYFWAYEYRYPMRDVTPAARRRVHATMIGRGLSLDGESHAHADAIRDALTACDRRYLQRMYGGPYDWQWWDR